MFFRTNRFQYNARPERPDPVYAKQLQEVLGGQWGEISVMMSYLFQGWNCRAAPKYRDMILDIGTEEIAHVEMLATMIARLLETWPVEAREDAAKDSAVGAILGGFRLEDVIVAGMNPQHAIVNGLGAAPNDSVLELFGGHGERRGTLGQGSCPGWEGRVPVSRRPAATRRGRDRACGGRPARPQHPEGAKAADDELIEPAGPGPGLAGNGAQLATRGGRDPCFCYSWATPPTCRKANRRRRGHKAITVSSPQRSPPPLQSARTLS